MYNGEEDELFKKTYPKVNRYCTSKKCALRFGLTDKDLA